MEWISVKERLPEKEVLAANFKPRSYGYKEYLIGYLSEYTNGTITAENNHEILENVTHWMPLPEPPKV